MSKMLMLLILVSYVRYFSCSNVEQEKMMKIVGGKPTNIKQFPYVVNIGPAVRKNDYNDCLCGGTILTKLWVMTAAHCIIDDTYELYKEYELAVLTGATMCYNIDTFSELIRIKQLIPHPKYVFSEEGPVKVMNDIAVLLLEKKITLGPNVQPVKLLTPRTLQGKDLLKYIPYYCTAIGWGNHNEYDTYYSPVLQKVPLHVIDMDQCVNLLAKNDIYVNRSRIMCTLDVTGRRDVCNGDSGGPLICSSYQVGIVSAGRGCAWSDSPNIWTRVDAHYEWIKSVILTTKTKRVIKMKRSISSKTTFSTLILFIYILLS